MAQDNGITIHGLEELDAKLDRIQRDIMPALVEATKKAQLHAHSRVPGYPPPPPLSTYRRTGTLGRKITTPAPKVIGSQVVGTIGTDVPYAPYVIGHEKLRDGRGPQAWMHVGRWWILRDVVVGARDAIVGIYRDAVRQLRRNWK